MRSFPQKYRASIQKVIEDPVAFISRLKVVNKEGRLVTLTPTDEQMEIIHSFFNEDKDLVILKPRQIGSTTINCAILYYLFYTSEEPISIVLLSHKLESSKEFLEKIKTFFNNMPNILGREIKENNKTQFSFTTGAEIRAMASTSKGGLRSFSANYILLSEYSFADDPQALKAAAIASVNNGRIIQESTANHYGDAHHEDVLRAQKNQGNLKLLFFPWSHHSEYVRVVPKDFAITREERELSQKFNLSPEQLAWRRLKIEQMNNSLVSFQREYPLTIDEAYGQHEGAYFGQECFQYLEPVGVEPEGLSILSEPEKGNAYVIGVDVASGSGGDYTVFCVLDKLAYSECAIWCSNTTPIPAAADILEMLGKKYNGAKIIIEANSIGEALITELRHRKYPALWKDKDGKSWNTNVKTKWIMFSELQKALKEGVLQNLDLYTVTDLKGFFINDKGNIEYGGSDGHGDRAIALALALQALKGIERPVNFVMPKWIKDRKIKQIKDGAYFMDKRRY